MNLFKLSWKYLTFRPFSTGLNTILLALGLAIITVLLLMQDQLEKKMNEDAEGIDLVVGAKGSPLQLILSSVYHIDFPTGNIALEEARNLTRNRLVKSTIPLALGDNYQGFRIVGTNLEYLKLYKTEFANGIAWSKPFEVVLGSEVATKLGLKEGDEFMGSHGISEGSHDHEANYFHVTGILKPKGNVVDRLILTSIESVWLTHEDEDAENVDKSVSNEITLHGLPLTEEPKEITTLLIQYRNPMAAIQLPRMVNSRTNMQAASPSFEMSRLFELLGVGISMLRGLAFVLIGISGLGIFIALFNSLKDRKYDLAILRVIGASRFQLLQLIFIEGFILTFLGAVIGILIGHSFLALIVSQNQTGVMVSLQPWVFLKAELWVVAYALVVGVLASVIPAITAYQTSIAKQLTKA